MLETLQCCRVSNTRREENHSERREQALMNTHLQREYNLTLIAMKAQGYAAMLNYYYTLWNFYLACPSLWRTAELPNVKLSGRHIFLLTKLLLLQ